MHTANGFITGWVCIITLAITLGLSILAVAVIKKFLAKQKADNKLPVKH